MKENLKMKDIIKKIDAEYINGDKETRLKVAMALTYRSLRYLALELDTDLETLLEYCENEKGE